jgi:hypothetical protein
MLSRLNLRRYQRATIREATPRETSGAMKFSRDVLGRPDGEVPDPLPAIQVSRIVALMTASKRSNESAVHALAAE